MHQKIFSTLNFVSKICLCLYIETILLILTQGYVYAQSISLPIRMDDIEEVWSFIDIDLNEIDKLGNTILHRHAATGHIDIIDSLIGLRITETMNIHQTNHLGNTPLYSATSSGREVITKMFIDLGMDVNATNDSGETPLHIAAHIGDIDIIKILIEAGSDLNKKDLIGKQPLYYAARASKNQAVGLLLGHGADFDRNYEISDYDEELIPYIENIDSELLPYIDKYENLKGSPIKDNIRFAFKRLRILSANCTVRLETIGLRWIFIDPYIWNALSPSIRELLLFHELGHCDLNRGHENNSFVVSVMNSGVPFQPIDDLLYEELFSKRNTSELINQWSEDEEVLKKFTQIRRGMSTFEILDLIGHPIFAEQKRQAEYWRYSFYQHRLWKEIKFDQEGQVTGIEDYKIAIYPDI